MVVEVDISIFVFDALPALASNRLELGAIAAVAAIVSGSFFGRWSLLLRRRSFLCSLSLLTLTLFLFLSLTLLLFLSLTFLLCTPLLLFALTPFLLFTLLRLFFFFPFALLLLFLASFLFLVHLELGGWWFESTTDTATSG
jgi:hypothetical protein